MKQIRWRDRFLKSTRGKILSLLRTKESTVNQLAAELQLTDNAVRAHLLSLERDGLAYQSGIQPGVRRPHAKYALTEEAEQIFPKAYGSLVTVLMSIFSRHLGARHLRAAMRQAGKQVAQAHVSELQGKRREERIESALEVLKELGGTARFEEKEGKHFICGNGCPLAAATANHPEACLIAESLLTVLIGTPVKEHCVRGSAPSCRFEINVK
jgi:predicted ArsR family transcriptional regulator